MEKELQKFVKNYKLADRKLLLAVSGGVDSMVMLDIFNKLGLNISVAHLNHNIRKASTKEAQFLKKYCQERKIPFYYKKLTAAPKSEEVARKARYQFLNQIKEKENLDYLLIAHHLNDQAETLLLKLTRGAGPVDLWGMKTQNNFHLRPFLPFPKKALYDYAKTNELTFFEDETNTDVRYARNAVRHTIIPELEKINPNLLNSIKNTIELGQAQSQLMESLSSKTLKELNTPEGLNLTRLKSLNPFLKSEVLKKYLKKQTGVETDRYKKGIEELLRIIDLKGNKYLKSGNLKLKKEYDHLKLEITQKRTNKVQKLVEGECSYNGFLIKLSKGKAVSGKNNILLPPTLAYNLHIRTWKVGDKIETFAGTKKLQDLFTDNKIPKSQRESWPIITRGEEILWVPMLAKSKRHIKKSTNESFKIEVKDERTTL